jgi:hypothetical protein
MNRVFFSALLVVLFVSFFEANIAANNDPRDYFKLICSDEDALHRSLQDLDAATKAKAIEISSFFWEYIGKAYHESLNKYYIFLLCLFLYHFILIWNAILGNLIKCHCHNQLITF